jgi:hypothetical protein
VVLFDEDKFSAEAADTSSEVAFVSVISRLFKEALDWELLCVGDFLFNE